jgi:RNA polymerase sigma-70 factor (ECF subfamily)
MIEAGLPTTGADPATTLLDRMDSEQVGRAVEELPDEYRAVATLYFMQDLSYQEIAEVLSVPVGTVRSRLHRGRKMLQKSLWHLAEESGIVRNLTRGDADT